MNKTFKTIMLVGLLIVNIATSFAQPFFKKHPQINPYNYQLVKEADFDHAAVTSAHPLASMVGATIMKDGGNAYDAAIAVQFSLAVVHPGAGNIGGGGFMLSRNVDGKLMGIDFKKQHQVKVIEICI
jgi:gamma-glutamyltranspeptidase/glutathione hydrolase